MERPSHRTYALLFLGVLLPALGMVLLGVVSLWQTLRSARLRAAEEARLAAMTTARGIRAALAAPAILDLFPPEEGFTLGPSGLEIPPGLGWFASPPPPPLLPAGTELLLQRAEEEEFQKKDPAKAARLLDHALGRKGLTSLERETLLLARAWIAERRKKPAKRDACLTALLAAKSAPPLRPGLLLLLSRAKKTLPSWTEETLLLLPRARALALLDLLDVPEPRKQRWKALLEKAEKKRRLLRTVQARLGILRGRKAPLVQPLGEEVLLFFPKKQKPGLGKGALVPREELVRRLREATALNASTPPASRRLPLFSWSGAVRFGSLPPVNGFPLWEGAWIAPLEALPGGIWSRPWILASLLLLLSLVFLLGLFLVLRAAARERAALQVRSEFLTSVTHELRTPLASIRMFAEMLAEGRVPSEEKRKEYYRLLSGETGRLSALVENVLDLGRMERGERAYDMRPLDFARLARRVLDLFSPLARREGLEVRARLEGPAPVLGDRNALEQALENLLENARKYAGPGRVLQVELFPARDGGDIRLRVRDQGPGIPPEERERIFEPFTRGKAQEDGSIPGVGLGLYLSRRILRAHGGDLLCLDPEDGGGGACFEIRLPERREEEG